MKEILEILAKIREALGGDDCEVMVRTSEFGGCIIRVYWFDGSEHRIERQFSYDEIASVIDTDILVDKFIEWARHNHSQALIKNDPT